MIETPKIEVIQLAGDESNWVSYRDCLTITLHRRRWQEHMTSVLASLVNEVGLESSPHLIVT